jgi:hypothetical protein
MTIATPGAMTPAMWRLGIHCEGPGGRRTMTLFEFVSKQAAEDGAAELHKSSLSAYIDIFGQPPTKTSQLLSEGLPQKREDRC